MIAQDTGSAIVGPARADLYFGAGAEAGKVSGRLRHNMHFVMLVPKSLDPTARGRKMPLPDPRPSAKIAKLFPQVDPLKDQPKDQKSGGKPAEASVGAGKSAGADPAKNAAATPAQPPAAVAQASPTQAAAATTVPLPEARPSLAPGRELHRRSRHRYYYGR
jgi:membrane-bound lytic murein transglycosylase A